MHRTKTFSDVQHALGWQCTWISQWALRCSQLPPRGQRWPCCTATESTRSRETRGSKLSGPVPAPASHIHYHFVSKICALHKPRRKLVAAAAVPELPAVVGAKCVDVATSGEDGRVIQPDRDLRNGQPEESRNGRRHGNVCAA